MRRNQAGGGNRLTEAQSVGWLSEALVYFLEGTCEGPEIDGPEVDDPGTSTASGATIGGMTPGRVTQEK